MFPANKTHEHFHVSRLTHTIQYMKRYNAQGSIYILCMYVCAMADETESMTRSVVRYHTEQLL